MGLGRAGFNLGFHFGGERDRARERERNEGVDRESRDSEWAGAEDWTMCVRSCFCWIHGLCLWILWLHCFLVILFFFLFLFTCLSFSILLVNCFVCSVFGFVAVIVVC